MQIEGKFPFFQEVSDYYGLKVLFQSVLWLVTTMGSCNLCIGNDIVIFYPILIVDAIFKTYDFNEGVAAEIKIHFLGDERSNVGHIHYFVDTGPFLYCSSNY